MQPSLFRQLVMKGRQSFLSIPFVGFLWMQQVKPSPPLPLPDIWLSIPFVGFLWMQRVIHNTLITPKRPTLSIPFVGFLWMQQPSRILEASRLIHTLSIPFVGFLWMQLPTVCPYQARWPQLSIPFVGFLWMQPMPFRLFFGELAGKISGSYRLPRSCNRLYKDKKTI